MCLGREEGHECGGLGSIGFREATGVVEEVNGAERLVARAYADPPRHPRPASHNRRVPRRPLLDHH